MYDNLFESVTAVIASACTPDQGWAGCDVLISKSCAPTSNSVVVSIWLNTRQRVVLESEEAAADRFQTWWAVSLCPLHAWAAAPRLRFLQTSSHHTPHPAHMYPRSRRWCLVRRTRACCSTQPLSKWEVLLEGQRPAPEFQQGGRRPAGGVVSLVSPDAYAPKP